jgi:RNA polymerase sigma-70 factor (ECF subfamily)
MEPDRGAYMYPEELALNEDESAVPRGSALERVDSEADLDFDELFQRYSSMVFRLAYHILGDREEALDVSQEVFLTIYRKLNTFRGESSLKTWIYCIAANRASNRCRWWNRLRRRGTVSLEEHLSNGPDQDHSRDLRSGVRNPEDELLLQEERQLVESALRRLPLQHRIAVIMRDIDGLSYEEIAESMRVSLGTVKSRIARGREMLKSRLGICR